MTTKHKRLEPMRPREILPEEIMRPDGHQDHLACP